jgi:hypothetical protein
MTGVELREILLAKWGASYDVQLRRTQGKIFFQVMWRYQEQASFPVSEADYLAHLEEVAAYLQSLGASDQIRDALVNHPDKPRLGKAVSLPIDLGARASEWL